MQVKTVIRGKRLTVSTKDVERVAQNLMPENIRKHYVIVNDRKFPPKQLLERLSKMKKIEMDRLLFTTKDASYLFTRLGFSSGRLEKKKRGILALEKLKGEVALEAMQQLIRKNVMSKVLLDTSFILALMDKKDRHHEKALKMSNRIEKIDVEVVCIDSIVEEIYSVTARKLRRKRMSQEFPRVAEVIADSLKDFNIIYTYRSLPKLHAKVVELMKRTRGRLNYHDALIAFCCKQEKVDKIATLDSDFDEIKWLQRICL